MFCPNCGKELPEFACFCGECGTAVTPPKSVDVDLEPAAPAPVVMPEPAPVVKPAPAPVAAPVKPVPAPKKKSKAGLVIGIVAAVLVLLAGTFAALVALDIISFDKEKDEEEKPQETQQTEPEKQEEEPDENQHPDDLNDGTDPNESLEEGAGDITGDDDMSGNEMIGDDPMGDVPMGEDIAAVPVG